MPKLLTLAADFMPLPFVICLAGFGLFQIGAYLVYALWIPTYIQRHGGKTAGFATHFLSGSAWLRDYREAHAICRKVGHAPWFMKVFASLEIAAILFFICGVGAALWVR